MGEDNQILLWAIGLLCCLCLAFGFFTLFFDSDNSTPYNPQITDAQLLNDTDRANALHTKYVQPWWCAALERIIGTGELE